MYQLWIQWTLHLHDTPEILIPAVMDGLAVIALPAFLIRPLDNRKQCVIL